MNKLFIVLSVSILSFSVSAKKKQKNTGGKGMEAITKKYDSNGDGKLDKKEKAVILKSFDKNKNGKLDQDERQLLVQSLRKNNPKAPANPKAAGAPDGGEKHIYKTVGDLELPLYIYNPKKHNKDAKVPAIVFFFGGGWANGSPGQFKQQCKYLADRGMVAITVEYRVSSRHNVKIEDCIEDAKSAMRWVRGNAAKLGIDPDRIASGGGSAGGHLAACVAVIDEFNAKTDDLKISPKPNAMVLFNPAIAIAKSKHFPDDVNKRIGASAKLDGRSRGPIEKVSPLNFAETKQAPCIMFFGTADNLKAGADVYVKVSTEAGNDCKMVSYEGQGHGFFNRGKYTKLTVEEMDKFLVNLGWLKAE